MNPIFISYRRDDGIDTAQLLQRDLQNMFGDDAVFLDTRTMKAGDEFPIELENAVKNAKVVIAMIGKNWKGTDQQVNRLMQEADWVRKELEMAMGDNNKKILPVFVKGTKLSDSFKDLPPSLERLTKYNGIELREKEFKHDLVQLVPVIEPFVLLNDPLKDLPIDEDRREYILAGSRDNTARIWRTFREMINPENTYVPTPEQMKEYDIPEDMEWGKV